MPDIFEWTCCYNIPYAITERKIQTLCGAYCPPEDNETGTIQDAGKVHEGVGLRRASHHQIVCQHDLDTDGQVVEDYTYSGNRSSYLKESKSTPDQTENYCCVQNEYWDHRITLLYGNSDWNFAVQT
jgi:hypothetical protein